MNLPTIGRLHVITDVAIQSHFTHSELARRAIEGGADSIQFRDKHLAGPALTITARSVVTEVAGRATIIVNDHAELAAEISANGVHVGQKDTSIAAARRLLGSNRLVGASTGSLEEALAAEAAGANYIGFGHIFATSSKTKPSRPVGLEALASVCAAVSVPVIAIGGINASNAAEVLDAGVWGIAVIGAVCTAPNPRRATAELAAIVAEKRSK